MSKKINYSIRLKKETINALDEFKRRKGLNTLEDAIILLLDNAGYPVNLRFL